MDTQQGLPGLHGDDPISIYPEYTRDLRDALNGGRLPFALAAGENVVSIPNDEVLARQSVAFPSGRFTVPPIIYLSVLDNWVLYVAGAADVTTADFTIAVRRVVNGNAHQHEERTVTWQAVQMSPDFAEG